MCPNVYWNNRIVRSLDKWYLAEVYYFEDGQVGWCNAIDYPFDSKEELVNTITHMYECLALDHLEFD